MTTSEDQPTTGTKDQWTPPPKSGTIRVQRGITTEAATITIDPIDMTKAVVLSNSKGSAGHVAARGSLNANVSLSPSGGAVASSDGAGGYTLRGSFPTYNGSASGSLTGGTTDLTTRQFSARLTSETTLDCDGAVEWQVVEYL